MKIPGSNSIEIPGTKTIHKIHYFEGAAELRSTAEHVLEIDCILQRECNIFTRPGCNTVFQDGEIVGRITGCAEEDLGPFVHDNGTISGTTIHLSNGNRLLVRCLEPGGNLRCVPLE